VIAAPSAVAADPALACEKAAGTSLVKCVQTVTGLQRKCFLKSGSGCGTADPKVLKAQAKLAAKIGAKCPSAAVVQGAGYPALTVASLVDRLQTACTAEASALVARTYGGPHGAVWDTAGEPARKCMDTLLKSGRKVITGNAKAQMRCIDQQRKSGNCDTAKTAAKIAQLETKAVADIGAACAATPPNTLVALTAAQYVARTAAQSRCMAATAHPNVSPLTLDCGPRAAIPVPPRGQFAQVVLDEATWGTRCGDGSPYAFRIRLAPVGFPVENVVVHMQGGGVCVFENDCNSVNAGLFEALSDGASQTGIMSNNPAVSPFANWTKVFLPYCTQDVFIGGGTTSNFPSITVHRFGSVNVRASMRYLRDVIWNVLDQDAEGYRPDRIKMLFGGTSAGAFGTLYNYHYVLDDLQWAHTSAWPDAGLALDNGQALGIASLGAILMSETPPHGWGGRPFMPPYCFANNCGLGERIYETSAPRLKAEPEQQFLVLTNQVDSTQVSTTFFPNAGSWINALRQSYCDTAGTNGLRYFLPAITASTHVIATRENLYTGQSVDGILMRDWLDLAMSDPDSAFDAVEEGALVGSIAGVNPFPCSID